MMRYLVLICLCFVASCAPRGAFVMASGDAGTVQAVFVATNRYAPDGAGQAGLGVTRDARLRFGRVDISIPPGHKMGRIEWPGQGAPDPARHFVAVGEAEYGSEAALLEAFGPAPEVVLFVHGYNVNHAEAVYRLAQIAHDFDADLPVIAYSWPSAGNPRGYVHDRDSVIFSRDGLERLLEALTGDGRRVLLVGHSMGSQLVMEVLRQLSISGRGAVLDGLSGVALISPDIDNEVFVQQARRIRPFPEPFMLVTSARDRILGLSAWLSVSPVRLGAIRDTEGLGGLPVSIVDLSEIEGGDAGGHSTAFTAPAAIRLLQTLGAGG